MALLTATQGTPYRIWALLQFLDACGGKTGREELAQWLNPQFITDGEEARSDKVSTAVAQTIDAAAGIELIKRDSNTISSVLDLLPDDMPALADEIFDLLLALEPESADFVVLEALAFLTVQTDKMAINHWAATQSQTDISDFLRDSLGSREGSDLADRFNATKLTHWRRWLDFLGLWRSLPYSNARFEIPHFTRRIRREIERGKLGAGIEMESAKFVQELAKALPFVDGGTLYLAASKRLSIPPKSGRISILVSAALRELHDEGSIKLKTIGDAAGGMQLAENRFSKIGTFHSVEIPSAESTL